MDDRNLIIAAENAIRRLQEVEHFCGWNNQQWINDLQEAINSTPARVTPCWSTCSFKHTGIHETGCPAAPAGGAR